MTKFQVGKTYYQRSICDHECIFRFTILSRTEKTVTITARGKTERRGISFYDGIEHFAPFGRYSMAPIVGADRVEA